MQTNLANSASRFLEGLALGAGLMYALDPARGKVRRGKLRDRLTHGVHEIELHADTAARDLGHRARGLFFDLRSVFQRERPDDDVLGERVHARLGHLIAQPRRVELTVRDGRVILHGKLPAGDLDRVMAGVLAVRGVRGVENRLETTALESHSRVPRLPFKWSPGARLVVALAGGATLAYAARRLG